MNDLKSICLNQLSKLNLTEVSYSKRLEEELKEINAQDAQEYFLNLRGQKYENENNLLVPYLLEICDEFDIDKQPKYVWGDLPDVDWDAVPQVRDYIKNEYAFEQFGKEHTCNIATYMTFGLRNSLIDMAKVFDLDRKEILALTTKLGIKDNEGEVLTWDTALEIYDELKEYLDKHPEMAEAAHHILHRNRNLGVHASGLIISGVPIQDFIPLVKDKDGDNPCSAWVEGQSGSDLGAVGLVKFDFLSLNNLLKIADAIRLAKEIYGIDKISALPEQPNWSDDSFLNDEKSLEMANRGDLKMIFQYDGSEGIRKLARQGGIDNFEDLAAYTALYRPGCIKVKMHEAYCNRKRGKELYTVHPKLDLLEKTYGVLIYQEQALRILNLVGKIPLKDCEIVRKAISKKKKDKFIKYKEMFVENGQIFLEESKEYVENLWEFIEAQSGYSFNRSHTISYSVISSMMLYLKAHYPIAFYCASLTHTKGAGPKDYIKLKDYKRESERHGVKVHQIDINKSAFECKIINNEIYYGLSKMKGTGISTTKIPSLQPFKNYEDFLQRFGTEATTNKAIIALRLFEGNPENLYRFYEAYKVAYKKKLANEKSRQTTIEKNENKLKENYDEKLAKRLENYIKNKKEFPMPTLDNFTWEEPIDEEYLELLKDKEKAEEEYYGFVWTHPLEKCKDYTGKTIEFFRENYEIGHLEVLIKKITEKKGPKAIYYSITGEDANGEIAYITVWSSDYKKYKEELQVNNKIRIQVTAPQQGYYTYLISKGFHRKITILN